MSNRPLRYRSYLLVIWEEREATPDNLPVWRFRLEDPLTAERFGFSDFSQLVDFLLRITLSPPLASVE